jgi:hypothetical protein
MFRVYRLGNQTYIKMFRVLVMELQESNLDHMRSSKITININLK